MFKMLLELQNERKQIHMYFVQYILYLKFPYSINTIKYIPRDNRIPSTANASEKSFHCNPLYLPTIIET